MNKLKRNRISKIVSKFNEINNKIPMLNSGGCGLFAEYAYDLFKGLGYEVKLCVLTDFPSLTRSQIHKGYNITEMTDIVHIVLEVDNHYIDSTGIYSVIEDIPRYGCLWLVDTLNIELLRDWNKHPVGMPRGWNPKFWKHKDIYVKVIDYTLNKIYVKHKPKNLVNSNKLLIFVPNN